MTKSTGARYEITVDGVPRSCRDTKEIAVASAQQLKIRSPHAEVIVRDLENGETIVIKHRPG